MKITEEDFLAAVDIVMDLSNPFATKILFYAIENRLINKIEFKNVATCKKWYPKIISKWWEVQDKNIK